jgi:hypothetical protein
MRTKENQTRESIMENKGMRTAVAVGATFLAVSLMQCRRADAAGMNLNGNSIEISSGASLGPNLNTKGSAFEIAGRHSLGDGVSTVLGYMEQGLGNGHKRQGITLGVRADYREITFGGTKMIPYMEMAPLIYRETGVSHAKLGMNIGVGLNIPVTRQIYAGIGYTDVLTGGNYKGRGTVLANIGATF